MKSFLSSQFLKRAITTAFTALSCTVIEANSAQAASLIQNGSFESGINPGNSFSTLYVGSRAIDGWFVTQGSIDYIGGYWESADGYRSLDLNALHPGGIAQIFNTTVGQEYQVNFAIAGNPVGLPFLKKMQVKAAGQYAYFSFETTGNNRKNMGWQEVSWEFTAVDSTTKLEFASLTGISSSSASSLTGTSSSSASSLKGTSSSSAYGIALDNVSVVASPSAVSVPEPGTLAGLFLLSLGSVLKRKVAS